MAPTTPMGSRSVKPSLPSPGCAASIGTISPVSVRASAAANWNVSTARAASTRAVAMGLAASSAMVRAKSSCCSRRATRGRVEDLDPLPRRAGPRPSPRCAACDRPVDVALVALRDAAEQRVVVGRPHLDRLVGGDELVADAHGTDADRTSCRLLGGGRLAPRFYPLPTLPRVSSRWPFLDHPGCAGLRPPGRGARARAVREHDARLPGGRRPRATATSRPTSTRPPTACSSPSTTTGSTG